MRIVYSYEGVMVTGGLSMVLLVTRCMSTSNRPSSMKNVRVKFEYFGVNLFTVHHSLKEAFKMILLLHF